jgi:hypothetical protein
MSSGNSGSVGSSGGSAGGGQKLQLPIPADGTTVFTMPDYPADEYSKLWLEVNGLSYYNPASFVTSGLLITWGNNFMLKTTDDLYVCYF